MIAEQRRKRVEPVAGHTQADLLAQLEAALPDRDVRRGFALLDQAFPVNTKETPNNPVPIALLLCLAEWCDLGFRNNTFFEQHARPVLQAGRAHLPLLDFLKLRLAEAYLALANEHPEDTIQIIDLILRTGGDLLGDHLSFLANFWKGRAHRKQGEYQEASLHLSAARAASVEAGAPKLVAVVKIHESWIAFQSGKPHFAFQLLDEAEQELLPTGHALSLGNIESARGRFVRRSGDYTRALSHFEAAIGIYKQACPTHPNTARALVNAAYVKRLIALDLQPGGGGHANGAVLSKSLKFAHEALDLLDQAGEIYRLHHHQTGTGSVLVNAAHIHLESGDIDQAATEAQRAYKLGEEKHDQILMARAKSVLSAVELERCEEQLGEQPNVAFNYHLAVDHADTAISLAAHTQNSRLLCEAYIARGMVAASGFLQDWETAREYAAKAAGLLTQNDRDHLYRQLGILRTKLMGAMRVDEMLRLWSDGQTGDKTFQEVQEEFAQLVIPKVWLRNGKNISLVAKTLSISPKKVRRVLRNANKL